MQEQQKMITDQLSTISLQQSAIEQLQKDLKELKAKAATNQ